MNAIRSLASLANYVNGRAFRPEEQGNFGVPVIRIRQLIDSSAEFDLFDGPLEPRHRVDDGDLIFSWSATLAVRQWDRGPAALNQHLFRVLPSAGVEQAWLRWVLEHALTQMASMMHGSAMTHITREMLRKVTVSLPAIQEQRRIADFLDKQVAQIDVLIASRERQLALSVERLSAQLDIATEKGGRFRLRPLLSVLRDGTHTPPPRQDAGVPLLTAKNVSSWIFGFTDRDTYISEHDAALLDRLFVPAVGDVLMSVKGTVGKVALVPPGTPRFQVERNLALLRPRAQVLHPRWLYWSLRSRKAQDQMHLSMGFSAQPGIYLGAIGDLIIQVPHMNDQISATSQLDAVSGKVQSLSAAIEGSASLAHERRRALITAAVTGEFDVSSAGSRATLAVTG